MPRQRIKVAGPDRLLNPSATVTLTLALHELATNAAKYGALSSDSGTIDVEWAVDEQTLTLVWCERGGPPVAKPRETGFGTRLLERAVARDLAARVHIDFDPRGVVCTISAALSRISP
jgi:two-component sensor histidine kinase